MKLRLPVSTLAIAAMLLAGCSLDCTPETKALSVCEAIDKGSQLAGKKVSVRGWIFASGHATMLGDTACPSNARMQYLVAGKGQGGIGINLADKSDWISRQVKSDIQRLPVWPAPVGFRGIFHGTLVARQPKQPHTTFNPDSTMVPFVLVVDRIDEFKVERPPFPPERSQGVSK